MTESAPQPPPERPSHSECKNECAGQLDRMVAPSLFGDVSPLILAAYNGDEAMFRLLVEGGADVESDGVGALAFALRAQCKTCVDMLLPGLPPVS